MKSLQSPFSKGSSRAPTTLSGIRSLFSPSRFTGSSKSSKLEPDPESVQNEKSDLDIIPEYLSEVARWDLRDLIKAIFARYCDCVWVGTGLEDDIVSQRMCDERLRISQTDASARADLNVHRFPLNLSILAFLAPLRELHAKHDFPFKALLTAYFAQPKKRQTVQRFLHQEFPVRVFLQELCTRGIISGRYQDPECRRLMAHVLALCKRGQTGQEPKWVDESMTLTAIPIVLAFGDIVAQNHEGMQELVFAKCARTEYDILHSVLQVAPLPCPPRHIGDEVSSRALHGILHFYETLADNHQELAADEERIWKRLQREARRMLDYDLEGEEFERTVLGGGIRAINDLEREMRATATDWAWKESDHYHSVWDDVWERRRRDLIRGIESELQPSVASAEHQRWGYVSLGSRERQRIYGMARLLEDGCENIETVRRLTGRKDV